MSQPVQLTPFDPNDASELTRIWRASLERALYPYHNPDPFESQERYLLEFLQPRAEITVARYGSEIAGFMAQVESEIEQLYVANRRQGLGIGSTLLKRAKQRSPERLHLYTFQRNLKARRFYLERGFREIAYGYRNMEGLADVEMSWG